MTREETIRKVLDKVLWTGNASDDNKRILTNALIEALEQEPCEDCISRAELLKAVDTWDRFGCDAGSSKLVPIKDCYVSYIHYDDVVKAIKGMPSVQPKIGHWIEVGLDDYKCSECGMSDNPYESNFCPDCGVKMLPTDSNCDSCKNQNEVDGSNCYECVKGIRNNYTADSESEIHCNCTDADIAKSFIEDVEVVKDLLPRAESEDKE